MHMGKRCPFDAVNAQLEKACFVREKTAFAAFSVLKEHLSDFSNMLISGLGNPGRAVHG
jgi:hypothetical protein